MRLLVSVLVIAGAAQAQKIVPAAMKVILPYADPTLVTSLTNNLNSDTTLAAQKTRLSNWVPKNWKKSGATVPSGVTSATTLTQAQAFVAHRDGLKKYINFQFTQLVNGGFLGKAKADTLKKLYWTTDKEQNNNFTATKEIFFPKAIAQLPAAKQSEMIAKVDKVTAAFAKKNAAAAKAMSSYTF